MAILSCLANNRLNLHSRRDQHVHWDPIGRSNQQEGDMNEVRYWIVKETASKPLDHPWAANSTNERKDMGGAIRGILLHYFCRGRQRRNPDRLRRESRSNRLQIDFELGLGLTNGPYFTA